jgi:MurNAc alpha-1-phosphate uridylyltransferase
MKTIILAAGRGERMQPLTDTTPKPLLKAGKKRLIEYTIDALVQAGLRDIVINHAHLGEQFPATLGDGKRYGARIQYSDEHQGRLETAGGIINALPLLGDTPFLVVNGDIWTDYPFAQLANKTLTETQRCHLVLVTNPQHNPNGDFSLSSGLLSDTGSEKYTYSGVGLYHPALFANLPAQSMPLKPILMKAIELKQAYGEIYQGQWSDIGTVARLSALSKQLSN